MADCTTITTNDIDRASQKFAADRANRIARNAVTSKGLRAVARVPEAAALNTKVFDIEVKQGARTDQQRSGRCWMFAALNTMRMRVIREYGCKNFELSQSYPLFWDKYEKSNWFFENIIDTLDEPLNGRLLAFLLTDPICDGGQWDMFKALVKKYGVVPKEAMPETACSKNTRELDSYLTRYLRRGAKRLRDAAAEGADADGLRALKADMLDDVYRFLVICLGEPPKSFEVRLRGKKSEPANDAESSSKVGTQADEKAEKADDEDDALVLHGTFTPHEFFEKVIKLDIDNYVSLISAPTADKPFNRTYTVSRLGNVIEAGGVRYLNLPSDELKTLAIAQMKEGLPVWFGCDVDQSFISDEGLMDLDALAVDELVGFDIESDFSKADRLDYGESLMTHAMVFEGVNLDENGKPTLWKVENSWGEKHGKDGFDSLTDSWFDEYVYQVVIHKDFLNEEQRKTFDTMEPIVLEPWDPMGALA